MTILCIICSRGGSKEVKNKALRKFFNKPLIAYTIRQAIKAKIFDKIILSTDSKKIQKIGKYYGAASWFLRPKNLALDNSPKLEVIKHSHALAEKHYGKKFQICVDLDITSPLRSIKDIKIILETTFAANKYINDMEPWGLRKKNIERMNTVLYISVELIRKITILLSPIIFQYNIKFSNRIINIIY